jgi:hypothetical protein
MKLAGSLVGRSLLLRTRIAVQLRRCRRRRQLNSGRQTSCDTLCVATHSRCADMSGARTWQNAGSDDIDSPQLRVDLSKCRCSHGDISHGYTEHRAVHKVSDKTTHGHPRRA